MGVPVCSSRSCNMYPIALDRAGSGFGECVGVGWLFGLGLLLVRSEMTGSCTRASNRVCTC